MSSPHPPSLHPICSCSPSVIYPCDQNQLFIGWHHKGICPIGADHSYKQAKQRSKDSELILSFSEESKRNTTLGSTIFCPPPPFSYLHADNLFLLWDHLLSPASLLSPHCHCDQINGFMVHSFNTNIEISALTHGHGCDM